MRQATAITVLHRLVDGVMVWDVAMMSFTFGYRIIAMSVLHMSIV